MAARLIIEWMDQWTRSSRGAPSQRLVELQLKAYRDVAEGHVRKVCDRDAPTSFSPGAARWAAGLWPPQSYPRPLVTTVEPCPSHSVKPEVAISAFTSCCVKLVVHSSWVEEVELVRNLKIFKSSEELFVYWVEEL
jgi:hypothetical protein